MGAGKKLVVLILEDQTLVRAGMRALVQASEPDAELNEAGSYVEAIQVLDGQRIDIAFLDIELRNKQTGLDILKYIRQKEMPCRAIMLSGVTDESTVLECLRLGASGYIQKDMEAPNLFRKALDTVFQGGVFLPSSILGNGGSRSNKSNLVALNNDIGIKGRPLEALYYICQGYSNKNIAHKMNVSESTVANDYNPKLFKHFKVASRAKLIIEVARRAIIVPRPSPVEAA